ncbi:DUF421 domain-containing protein [Paenibacillus sp. TRM 82003]|nr:DUF421 domain-containing protein [Paenibacillus sp. TRM 82003]
MASLKGMEWIWMAVLMTFTGFVLLRFVGRKSISQMTIPTTVIMISIGSIMIQPFVEKNIWKTIGSASLIVLVLIVVEFLQVKFQWLENLLSGKSLPVIENGRLNVKNLKKMRMTVDQLEMRLRKSGHGSFSEIEVATLEPNGNIGIVPKPDFRPVTMGELKKTLDQYFAPLGVSPSARASAPKPPAPEKHPPLFQETIDGRHEGEIDPKLQ